MVILCGHSSDFVYIYFFSSKIVAFFGAFVINASQTVDDRHFGFSALEYWFYSNSTFEYSNHLARAQRSVALSLILLSRIKP